MATAAGARVDRRCCGCDEKRQEDKTVGVGSMSLGCRAGWGPRRVGAVVGRLWERARRVADAPGPRPNHSTGVSSRHGLQDGHRPRDRACGARQGDDGRLCRPPLPPLRPIVSGGAAREGTSARYRALCSPSGHRCEQLTRPVTSAGHLTTPASAASQAGSAARWPTFESGQDARRQWHLGSSHRDDPERRKELKCSRVRHR